MKRCSKARKLEAAMLLAQLAPDMQGVNLGQLCAGIQVEHEHAYSVTNLVLAVGGRPTKRMVRTAAAMIALDHLREIPDYYTRLARMEREAGVD